MLARTPIPLTTKVEPRSNNAIAAGLSSFAGTKHHQSLDLARHPEKSKQTNKKMWAKDRPLANDFVTDEAFDLLLDAWFGNAARVLQPGRSFYVWGGYANFGDYPPFLKKHGLYFSQAVIWDKLHPVLTRKDFMGAFEIAFYGWREGAGHSYFGPNNATDLWHVKKVTPQHMVHLTEKPVELAARAMQYSSRPGENVLGSRSSPARRLNGFPRRCRHELTLEYYGSIFCPFGAKAVPRRYRLFAWIAPLLLLNWLLLAVIPVIPTGGSIASLAIQVLGGTVFGQTAAAAAWTAFGPTPFMWRLPLSLTWLAMLALIHALNGWLNSRSPSESISVGVLLLCQWLLLQFPLWGIAIGFRVQLQHADEIESGENPTRPQFGIRQLMLVTAVVGVLFGLGRIAIPHMFKEIAFFPIFARLIAFFVAAEALMTLPLVVAALLRRHTVIGVLSALTLIGLITACELQLLKMMVPTVGSPGVLGIIAVNVGTAAMLLLLLTIVRLNGYSLTTSRSAAKG